MNRTVSRLLAALASLLMLGSLLAITGTAQATPTPNVTCAAKAKTSWAYFPAFKVRTDVRVNYLDCGSYVRITSTRSSYRGPAHKPCGVSVKQGTATRIRYYEAAGNRSQSFRIRVPCDRDGKNAVTQFYSGLTLRRGGHVPAVSMWHDLILRNKRDRHSWDYGYLT